ncbi:MULTISPECIES: amino acid adenylation domain-containing protein [unclassified Streptomyces]|uniref:amino acid adenylation domain-containing protein n=1 Tax=unclassified Streptomyces TaxID=2593676 RepID=UPI000B508AEB|nr:MULTISPECIES: amino acid adenylation domain-containing protein [unclassified Streptomyces]MYX04928.1 amino acid adenylation domain-containing protein [Streptomyces sp. SID8378]PVC99845.1 amino acid adenylation domain-containing protein [Streptomyces sp. CS147]SNB89517.1 amino acid adenylation domain-containing protein [Streptomyces sp. PgraA7]
MTPPVQHPSSISGAVRTVQDDSVVRMVRRTALLRPDSVAVESAATSLTYGRLWHRALVIAAALDEAGAGPGDRVALWADRTAGTTAAALGIMLAGAAYVPIDPSHPGDRTDAVLAGSQPTVLLHDGAAASGLPARVPAIDVRTLPDSVVPPERELPRAEDTAYVVFTSGSTGTPKGVMVTHGSLANYVSWCGSLVGTDGIGSPLFASLGFDLAMTSLWVPLSQGRRVVAVAGQWDQATLFDPRADRFTFIKLTPSHARFFDVLAQPPRYRDATRLLMFGGEGLDPALIASLGSRIDGIRLVNHYGPTETTIGCCAYAFDNTSVPSTPTVPIGAPAWNTTAYVVDEQLRPVMPGQPGELVIAGAAVAAGYLGERGFGDKFIDARDLGAGPGRAYRTGDIVELLPEKALLYLGRRDDQLKVNGHRVELGELRHHVLAVPGVADAAFDIVRGPVDSLELFIRPVHPGSDGEEFAETVRKSLATALPSALVPQSVRVVRDIVFNANGKCDVAATRRLLEAAS